MRDCRDICFFRLTKALSSPARLPRAFSFLQIRRLARALKFCRCATVACPSMKGHGNSFPVTIDALVGARFLPIMGWCRHNDSHFLRALCTKQHPGVSKDCLVRLVMLHRHDDSPSVGKRLAPMAGSRLYKIAHWTRARSIGRSAVPGCQKAPERSSK
jgi:hypothetical protein